MNVSGKLAAIAVCGSFGAVKEQSGGLYAQHMAERGFLAAALDPRIKATVASTMYDMSEIAREGYFGSADSREACDEQRRAWAVQRIDDYSTITNVRAATTSAVATQMTAGMSRER